MKHWLILVSLLLVPVLGGCSFAGGGPAAAREKVGESTKSTTENADLVVGGTATTTEDGNTLTVFSYESPLPPTNSSESGPNSEFSAIEVEGCASSSSGRDLMHVGSPAFVLQMPDGDRILPVKEAQETEVKEAVLETMDPVPGQCERGFVVFQTPRGERPEFVVFEEQFKAEREAQPIRWAVPDEQ
jgi:hypothetical protein